MNKSIIILLISSFSMMGCFVKPLGEAKKRPKIASPDVVDNEFVFAGDKARVEKALAEMNIEASIYPIIKNDSYRVRYNGDHSYEEIAEKVGPLVEFVEPNYRVFIKANMNKSDWPKDKHFPKLWGLNNIGQSAPHGLPGDRGADLNIMKAWSLTKGSEDVIVAVLDSGVDYTHDDLKANIWVNKKEAAGKKGADEDGNDYYDDVYGWDFANNEPRREPYYGKLGDPDPMDENGHGSHCAGTIAAAHNDIGVVGVAPNVKIMPVRMIDSNGGGNAADAAEAIEYAANNGADIISASWGWSEKNKPKLNLLRRALRRAQEKGVLFVGAAGNDTASVDTIPSYPTSIADDGKGKALNNIITVGASDNKDNPAFFTNYGHRGVHVFAPGVSILSVAPRFLDEEKRSVYQVMSGTSMAAPHVAGVAALMISYNKAFKRKPDLIRDTMIATCDEKPSMVGKAVCNGRVNAYRAMTADISSGKPLLNWQTKNHSFELKGPTKELIDIRHEIKVEGAKMVKLHFDFLHTDEPYDSIYLYDKDLRLIARVEETDHEDYWSPTVPGDTVTVRFVNSIVRRVSMMPMEPQSSEAACTSKGALEVREDKPGVFTCMIDSDGSSSGGSDSGDDKEFNSFKSRGFSIDQVSYVMNDEQPSDKQ